MPEEKHSTGKVVFRRIGILQEHPFGHLQNCLKYSIFTARRTSRLGLKRYASRSPSGYQSQIDDTD